MAEKDLAPSYFPVLCAFKQKACLSPTPVAISVGFVGLHLLALLCVRMPVMSGVLILKDGKSEGTMSMELSLSLGFGLWVTSLI